MYGKSKNSTVPSDAQAREKLAIYVYEYLLHVGAQKSAHTFLSEIGWEKKITLGEAPGFLHSWWGVFWDLYCAAPDRRDQCEYSSEAKAFHDYGFVNSGGFPPGGAPGNGMMGPNGSGPAGMGPGMVPGAGQSPSGPPNAMGPSQLSTSDGMASGGPMGPNFFPNASMRPSPPTSRQSPHPQQQQQSQQSQPQQQPHPSAQHNPSMMMGAGGGAGGGHPPFMGAPRYPAGGPANLRPGLRMPPHGGMGNDFNGPPGGPGHPHQSPMMGNNPMAMDSSRQGGEPGDFVGGWPPPGAGSGAGNSPMHHPRMSRPRGPSPHHGMGGPMGGPGMYGGPIGPGGMRGPPPMGPGGMPPGMVMGGSGRPQWQPNGAIGSYAGGGHYPGSGGGGPPGNGTPIMHSSPQDPSNGGNGKNMYGSGPGGPSMDFPMGPMGPNSGMNGPAHNGNDMDGIKNSPAHSGPGTPRDESGNGMGDFNLGGFVGPGAGGSGVGGAGGELDQSKSEAIMKIKESMQEEAKRFEKDTDPDFFMQ